MTTLLCFTKNLSNDHLPSANTCVSRLYMPHYTSKNTMYLKLRNAKLKFTMFRSIVEFFKWFCCRKKLQDGSDIERARGHDFDNPRHCEGGHGTCTADKQIVGTVTYPWCKSHAEEHQKEHREKVEKLPKECIVIYTDGACRRHASYRFPLAANDSHMHILYPVKDLGFFSKMLIFKPGKVFRETSRVIQELEEKAELQQKRVPHFQCKFVIFSVFHPFFCKFSYFWSKF
ncbi:unnamed protein product, partial [Mesorhabditis belari]|uniref:HECT domain-containing protein n=1 Tax=Mesorhabditis belari TaxID=2138241 RepID=A0AAF3JAW2_9BILA